LEAMCMCEGVGALCLAGGRHTWMDDQSILKSIN
jgi:hypothetical protein